VRTVWSILFIFLIILIPFIYVCGSANESLSVLVGGAFL
jgi:Na+-transporting methylmalonyl-CoA/oxaloacetate decarboxylase gamma subunit